MATLKLTELFDLTKEKYKPEHDLRCLAAAMTFFSLSGEYCSNASDPYPSINGAHLIQKFIFGGEEYALVLTKFHPTTKGLGLQFRIVTAKHFSSYQKPFSEESIASVFSGRGMLSLAEMSTWERPWESHYSSKSYDITFAVHSWPQHLEPYNLKVNVYALARNLKESAKSCINFLQTVPN